MKASHIAAALCLLTACSLAGQAQNVIAEDNFDGNELSWTENSRPDLGENIIIDGGFKFDSKGQSIIVDYTGGYPNLLVSEGVMPVNPAQGFSISVDMTFDKQSSFTTNLDMMNANMTGGILLEYDDDYNFIAVGLHQARCYLLFYEKGKLVRYKVAAVKTKTVDKNKILANLKIEYRDYRLTVFVDNIEMTAVRKVNIESPVIGLYVTGRRKVTFDNVVISQ